MVTTQNMVTIQNTLQDFLNDFLKTGQTENENNQYFTMGEDKKPEDDKNAYKKGKMGPKIKTAPKDTQLNEIQKKGVLTVYGQEISYEFNKNSHSNTQTYRSECIFKLIFKEEEYKLVRPYFEGITSNLGYLYTLTTQSSKDEIEKISAVISFLNIFNKQIVKKNQFIAFQGTCTIVHHVSITENSTTVGAGNIASKFTSNTATSRVK